MADDGRKIFNFFAKLYFLNLSIVKYLYEKRDYGTWNIAKYLKIVNN